MIKIGLLGGTGSIGKQTLQEIRLHKDLFQLQLVSAYSNTALLSDIINEFQPSVAFCNGGLCDIIGKTKVYCDISALNFPEVYNDCDLVINGIGGFAGLLPSIAVLNSRANLATANKESIVSGGKFLTETARKNNKKIFPIDSEHSAIFQCLIGENCVKKLILTASGGAFRNLSKEELGKVTSKDALAHPTWKMGKKVTIDSATLMNKGLEIIEAKHLFGYGIDVEAVMHPESIVHALVEFEDGFMKALLSNPDMRLPIRYAMANGKRISSEETCTLNLAEIGKLTFKELDRNLFPCLAIGEEVAKNLDLGVVLIAADEVAVNKFLRDEIGFNQIPQTIRKALDKFGNATASSIDDVICIEKEVREYIR